VQAVVAGTERTHASSSVAGGAFWVPPELLTPTLAADDLSTALEASVREADTRTVEANADLGNAILQSRAAPSVQLLEYTRVPAEFEQFLLRCEELAKCWAELRANGHVVQLDSGARVFVEPELYEVVMGALQLHEGELQSRHVVASQRYAEVVRATLAKIPRKLKVKEKGATSLTQTDEAKEAGEWRLARSSEAEPAEADEDDFPILMKNSFLHIPLPSSLFSDLSVKARSAPTQLGA